MKQSLADLYLQRGRLQERIASQRAALAEQLAPLQRSSDTVQRVHDLMVAAINYLKTHPLQVGLALSAVALLNPRRAWRWLWRGVGVWRSWKALRAWVPASVVSRWF